MRVAFYAPLKPPGYPIPSGDRRVAQLLIQALKHVGHNVTVASQYRSYCQTPSDQETMRVLAVDEVKSVITNLKASPPDLWFTYHLYYKAPDFIGPKIARKLNIPYVICEASYAPKQSGGPWKTGHDATAEAIATADRVISLTQLDSHCVLSLLQDHAKHAFLSPFVDSKPFTTAAEKRKQHRTILAQTHGLDPKVPWLVTVAMMRKDQAKLLSFEQLAMALRKVKNNFQLVVAGAGAAQTEVRHLLTSAIGKRFKHLGQLDQNCLANLYSAGDLYVWPAVNEAFGMAFLEAQAAGLPVVAAKHGGVTDVVLDGVTGRLVEPNDVDAFVTAIDRLLSDRDELRAMSSNARDFISKERTLDVAAEKLDKIIASLAQGS